MELPIYELTIDPTEENKYEVTAVAFVDAPAIERDFIAFNAQDFVNPEKGEHEAEFIPRCISYVVGEGKDQQQAAGICYGIWEQHFKPAPEPVLGFAIQNEECREVFGAAMIPDMLIYRNDGMGEYYVKFSADTIKQIAEKFFTKDYHKSANIMHESGTPLDGVVFFQSLIKDSTKGISLAGDHPDGTWFLGAKINNEALWQGIKAGKYKGFSVEGLFAGKPTNAAQMQYQKILDILNGTDL